MTGTHRSAPLHEQGLEVWNLSSDDSRLVAQVVPALGGIVSSLRYQGRELLFRHPWFWDPASLETRGGIPFLFPVCGRLMKDGVSGAYAWEGRTYKLPIHGFAMRLPWRVVSAADPNEVELALEDNEGTRVQYPFRFVLTMHHAVRADGYSCTLRVTNRSNEPMPYYAGFHPYFLADAREQVLLGYQSGKRFYYDSNFTALAGEALPPSCPVPVTSPELQDMLCRLDAPEVTAFVPGAGEIQVSVKGFEYLQLYVPQEQPFFCVEPWMAWAGAMNSGPEAVRRLPPGATDSYTLAIRVKPSTRSG